VIASQGYIAGLAALGTCVVSDYGSMTVRKGASELLIAATPFGPAVLLGRALTMTRKLGKLYRVGTTLYNTGMFGFRCMNYIGQAPMIVVDMICIGEIHIPAGGAKWGHAGNATADAESTVGFLGNQIMGKK